MDSNISALEMPEEHPDRSSEHMAGRMSCFRCEVADEVFVAPELNPNLRPESDWTDIAAICDKRRVDWLQQPLPSPAQSERLKQWGERRLRERIRLSGWFEDSEFGLRSRVRRSSELEAAPLSEVFLSF
jgi:hypothetical protein